MEPTSEVAVSLDELTLDLSEEADKEVNNEYFVTSDSSDRKVSPSTPTQAADTPFVNLNFILQDVPQDYSAENYKEKYEEQSKQEISQTDDEKKLAKDGIDIISSQEIAFEQKENPETEAEDFEADLPPLTLFSSQRNDDSDDSEFEFPEPNQTTKKANQYDEMQKNATTNDALQIESKLFRDEENIQSSDQKEVLDVYLNTSCGIDLEPQILTPREKVSSDLPDALLLRDVLMNEKSNRSDKIRDGYQNSSTLSSITQENQVDVNKDEDQDNGHFAKPSIITTAEDWEGVQTVEPGFADPSQKGSGAAPIIESKPLATYSGSWEEMVAMDYSSIKNNVKCHVERRGFSALTHLIFGPPKLQKDLLPEKELVFCIAGTSFDNDKEVHNRLLQTIYRLLTGSKFDCQRYGGHWEEIGFQGRDPATDLRGTGMLALLHVLYFLRDPLTKALARDIYKLSLHPTQNFPFCIMSINVTRICLQVFREDVYNKECNKRKDVIGTMDQVYAALFLHLFLLWKKGKTIADSGYVLQDVESYSRKHSKDVFKDLESYEKRRKQEGLFGDRPENNPSFLDVCKEDKFDNKTTAELY